MTDSSTGEEEGRAVSGGSTVKVAQRQSIPLKGRLTRHQTELAPEPEPAPESAPAEEEGLLVSSSDEEDLEKDAEAWRGRVADSARRGQVAKLLAECNDLPTLPYKPATRTCPEHPPSDEVAVAALLGLDPEIHNELGSDSLNLSPPPPALVSPGPRRKSQTPGRRRKPKRAATGKAADWKHAAAPPAGRGLTRKAETPKFEPAPRGSCTSDLSARDDDMWARKTLADAKGDVDRLRKLAIEAERAESLALRKERVTQERERRVALRDMLKAQLEAAAEADIKVMQAIVKTTETERQWQEKEKQRLAAEREKLLTRRKAEVLEQRERKLRENQQVQELREAHEIMHLQKKENEADERQKQQQKSTATKKKKSKPSANHWSRRGSDSPPVPAPKMSSLALRNQAEARKSELARNIFLGHATFADMRQQDEAGKDYDETEPQTKEAKHKRKERQTMRAKAREAERAEAYAQARDDYTRARAAYQQLQQSSKPAALSSNLLWGHALGPTSMPEGVPPD